jgi:2-polyprenyl-6-methoxyphenol hydroxylase-like FAD-dependent oxidoreductase
MAEQDYDVVIVGGRPAGASLAIRLGKRGHRVLLVDRAHMPSLPAVPSSAAIYPSTFALLDELGIEESSYASALAKVHAFSFQFGSHFDTFIPIPTTHGRDYVAGLDRSRFDAALWRAVERWPSVEQREGFAVHDLLRDAEGRVLGVVGGSEGESHTIRARCVVGADGRFSLVARKAGARVLEEEAEHVSTVYYAAWAGVPSFYEGVETMHVFTTGAGLAVPFFTVPGGLTLVNTHQRADHVVIDGDPQRYYDATLQSIPEVACRLRHAEQVGELVGVKRIGNGYREASGEGWVLVGDAVHYKDPVDGQGMFDALTGARLLDAALASFLMGERTWADAMAHYRRTLHEATHPMYVETVTRLRRELYEAPPVPIIKTLIRWMMTDPVYQDRFMHYLARAIPVEGWLTKSLLAGAVVRGIGRDLRRVQPRHVRRAVQA